MTTPTKTHLWQRLPVGCLRGLGDLRRDETVMRRTDGLGNSWIQGPYQRAQLSASVTGTTVGTQGVIPTALLQGLRKERNKMYGVRMQVLKG